MLILPAIDIIDGKCVRLRQGDYRQKTVYSASPADVAKQYADAGFTFLHVVDLQGAKEKKIINWDSIASIIAVSGLQLEVGGGIRTTDDIKKLLDIGVSRVVIGSVAAKSPELVEYWIKQFGPEKIVIGMDVKDDSVAISGWLEDSHRAPMGFVLDLMKRGATIFICTDISRDGMLGGVNVDFYKNLKSAFPKLSIIASGGISTLEDVRKLQHAELTGVIVGKAIYENKFPIEELAKMNGAIC
ncbi:MAG: 1-(5-phosphoribosyl)-5-[(5-phosphoribosylamino)methylideneamino]imidazole-4-carboxamide isomerase [Ignavibacteriae bacterium]|nr:MAG: 1-(5-phosphoribosyl)-5-[(5-phosphoribosylamino)methylideneamino]imidazole-4-carboxamide isomerase [Ignavibacteriota bacterium]